MTIITITIPGRGAYDVTAGAYDATIEKYLPSSPYRLRKIVEERTGEDYSDIRDVSTFLGMLADFDHNVDSSPLSTYFV